VDHYLSVIRQLQAKGVYLMNVAVVLKGKDKVKARNYFLEQDSLNSGDKINQTQLKSEKIR
jgi:hypothetical protein